MNVFQHYQLLLRRHRSLALQEIIEQVVRPGALVLDAGCGSGILSVWAAKRGAMVIAVDMADLALARSLADENHVADRITFLQGDLSDLGLEKYGPFDVLLAMIYLNDPRRDMDAVHITHSLKRYLAPGAVMVPDKVIYTSQAIECPSQDQNNRLASFNEGITSLEFAYGINMDSFRRALATSPSQGMFPVRDEEGIVQLPGAKELGEPLVHHVVDYYGEEMDWPTQVTLPIRENGRVTTMLWQQELLFGDKLIFRNGSIGWVSPAPLVVAGTKLKVACGVDWLETNVLHVI